MYPCTKFQLIWRTSVFGTKFAPKILEGGVLGQTQTDNNLFWVKNTIIWLNSGGFQVVSGGFKWFEFVPRFKYIQKMVNFISISRASASLTIVGVL